MPRVVAVVALVLAVALAAPAVAVCAGTTGPRQAAARPAGHECCPPDEDGGTGAPGVASPEPGTGMTPACCAMADEAARRAPVPASAVVTAPSSHVAAFLFGATPVRPPSAATMAPSQSPPPDPHVPRYLRLSVLIV